MAKKKKTIQSYSTDSGKRWSWRFESDNGVSFQCFECLKKKEAMYNFLKFVEEINIEADSIRSCYLKSCSS